MRLKLQNSVQPKRQRRSVPWPMEIKKTVEPRTVFANPDDGVRDSRILSSHVKAKFFGSSFNIGSEVLIGDLSAKLHRINIDPDQVLKIDRKHFQLSEAMVYRIKSQLYKVAKEKLDGEREKIRKYGGNRRPS